MSSIAADIKVEGFVQGVGFRYFCYKIARELNITGWVKNIPDSSVSVYAEGDRGQLEELISRLKIGPSAATVKDIKIQWREYTGQYKSFEVAG